MKALLFASMLVSYSAFAAPKAKFIIKCNDGQIIKATELVIGQDFQGNPAGEEFVGFRLENGNHETLYRLVGSKNVTCQVEVAK